MFIVCSSRPSRTPNHLPSMTGRIPIFGFICVSSCRAQRAISELSYRKTVRRAMCGFALFSQQFETILRFAVAFFRAVRYNTGMKNLCRSDSDVRKHLIIRRESANGAETQTAVRGRAQFCAGLERRAARAPLLRTAVRHRGGGRSRGGRQRLARPRGRSRAVQRGTEHAERTRTGLPSSSLRCAI